MERDDGLLSDSGIHGRGDGVPHFDDSFKVVVQEVNEAPFVSVGNVSLMDSIMEVREILSRLKSKVFVRFVSRFGNALTDFLAKQGVANGLV
ncbi:hypothetical protein LWI28_025783 [Acer negundo]|uniref:Uncharacterized protein n=1 Tax=Acer negundo TaxID=4023 RepID=A0AAD5JFB5_ACENE|nr:hypothetical protein LWI28_009332 [Acer negundo]KAI9196652.1 hypothetical protein LWI28_025783 [Acer negundo]